MLMRKFYSRHGEMTQFKRRRMVTSWPISALWVFLSFSLAILSTFSFLQADWVVKRDLIVTSFYQKNDTNGTMSMEEEKIHRGVRSYLYLLNQTSHRIDISNEQFEKFLPKYTNIEFENETIVFDNNFNRISKVTKVIITVRFGLIGVCTSPTNNGIVQCFLYENWTHKTYPISNIWPMLTLVGGSGCVTLCVCAVLSLLAVALPSSGMRHQVAKTIGHAQTVGVILLVLSLLGFPLGFTSPFVRHHCGQSSGVYRPGDCEIGWAYALVLVSTSLTLYCPVLVKFTAEIRYGAIPKYL